MRFPRHIGEVLGRGLGEDPERLAVITRSSALSYRELDSLANQAARELRALGVTAGDRIGVCLPNDADILVAFHGAMRIGAVWVGINQALAPPEKAYILADSGAGFALFDSATAQELADAPAELPNLKTVVALGTGSGDGWRARIRGHDDSPVEADVDPLTPAAIAYTSGTTGYPKGAVHSHVNLLLPGAYLVSTRGYDAGLRKGDCFPLTIINMMVLTTLLTAQAGGTAVIMDSLSARDVARWIREQRVTVWNGPPPVLYTMAHDDTIDPAGLATLSEVWSGGADCPEPIRNAFEQKFAGRVYGTYGLTEMPTVVAIEPLGQEHVAGSSGRPLPHIELSIRDTEGRELPLGEVGEICVGARPEGEIARRLRADWGMEADGKLPRYRTMLGYWEKPEQTARTLSDGVLHTGDAGALDSCGNLKVSDRINLVLNRGGANVYPAEVERVVHGFAAVDACGVLGVDDERLGQRIGMLVQFKPGREPDVEGLIAHCRTQLAPYKVPELVEAVDGLPRNAMGKIDRRALSELGAMTLACSKRITHA